MQYSYGEKGSGFFSSRKWKSYGVNLLWQHWKKTQSTLLNDQTCIGSRCLTLSSYRTGTERRTVSSMVAILKECSRSRDLRSGKQVHADAVDKGLLTNEYVVSSLINMYAHCGSMADAQKVFDGLLRWDPVSWNALLQGYVENGESELALKLFEAQGGCSPDARTYLAALTACASLAESSDDRASKNRWLRKGQALHSQAVSESCCNIYVENKLIDMYSKCESMELARSVFDSMVQRTAVSWTSLLQGYVENGQSELAIKLFDGMEEGEHGCAPINRTYVVALTACATLGGATDADRNRWSAKGRDIHSRAMKNRCCDVYVETAVIGLYARCGNMVQARTVLDGMAKRNVVTWNALLQGYVDNGEYHAALHFYNKMEEPPDRCVPDVRTYTTALSACAGLVAENREGFGRWLTVGKAIHSRAVQKRCRDIFLESTLVDFYAKCSSMAEAKAVFDGMSRRNKVTWNAIIQGYVENGEGERALELYSRMERECVPDDRTYVAGLTACASLARQDGQDTTWLDRGKAIHSQVVASKCSSTFIENTLVHMYGKFRCMSDARRVFDSMARRDAVSWNCLAQGYVDNGECEAALEVIGRMDTGLPDCATFMAGLMACGRLSDSETGRELHADVLRRGLEANGPLATCLVDFYGKCGRMDTGEHVFDSITGKDSRTYDTFMFGYSQQGDTDQVFKLFQEMREFDIASTGITFTHILSACSHAGLSDTGKRVFHSMLPEFGVPPSENHYNCLVDMLGRANYLEEALEIAMNMPFKQDRGTWTTLLSSCLKWKNDAVGKAAYECLLKVDEKEAAAYVLMANIYKTCV